jgi:hypothetical protein
MLQISGGGASISDTLAEIYAHLLAKRDIDIALLMQKIVDTQNIFTQTLRCWHLMDRIDLCLSDRNGEYPFYDFVATFRQNISVINEQTKTFSGLLKIGSYTRDNVIDYLEVVIVALGNIATKNEEFVLNATVSEATLDKASVENILSDIFNPSFDPEEPEYIQSFATFLSNDVGKAAEYLIWFTDSCLGNGFVVINPNNVSAIRAVKEKLAAFAKSMRSLSSHLPTKEMVRNEILCDFTGLKKNVLAFSKNFEELENSLVYYPCKSNLLNLLVANIHNIKDISSNIRLVTDHVNNRELDRIDGILEYEAATQELFDHLNEVYPWLLKLRELISETNSFELCITDAVTDDLLENSPITKIYNSTKKLRKILQLEEAESHWPVAKTFPSAFSALTDALSSFSVRFLAFGFVAAPWQTNRLLKININPIISLQLVKNFWPNAFSSIKTTILSINTCPNGGVNSEEMYKNLDRLNLTVETFTAAVTTFAKVSPMLLKIAETNSKIETVRPYFRKGAFVIDYLIDILRNEDNEPILTKEGLVAISKESNLSKLRNISIVLEKMLKAALQ